MALPFLRAFSHGGAPAAAEFGADLAEGIRSAMLLAGVRRVADLQRVPRVLGPRLRSWLELDAAAPRS
jgi:isopentenyl diphosphate isomerase/L-lactate dehydrogenase-like FMN-dependent dehydrogenase